MPFSHSRIFFEEVKGVKKRRPTQDARPYVHSKCAKVGNKWGNFMPTFLSSETSGSNDESQSKQGNLASQSFSSRNSVGQNCHLRTAIKSENKGNVLLFIPDDDGHSSNQKRERCSPFSHGPRANSAPKTNFLPFLFPHGTGLSPESSLQFHFAPKAERGIKMAPRRTDQIIGKKYYYKKWGSQRRLKERLIELYQKHSMVKIPRPFVLPKLLAFSYEF